MEQLRSAFLSIQFKLRNNLLGRVRLRTGKPTLPFQSADLDLYRNLLRALFPKPDSSFDQVWDIGCRNWTYIESLAETFPAAKLIGLELDGNRRYWNLYRRKDIAETYAQKVRERGRSVQCYFTDFRNIKRGESTEKKTLFSFFFPFVSTRPCLMWGLPKEYADFESLLRHTRVLCPTETRVISFHQGPWEAEIARSIYLKNEFKINEWSLDRNNLNGTWKYPFPIYCISAITSSFTKL